MGFDEERRLAALVRVHLDDVGVVLVAEEVDVVVVAWMGDFEPADDDV